MNADIVAKLEKVRNLPTLPLVIEKLRRMIANPQADAARVSRIIEDDPSMMTRILKIVNSVFYAGVEPITSVQHAVARMGFSAVSNIALSTFIFSSFDSERQTFFDRQQFWRHCISTGITADVVYRRTRNLIGQRLGQDLLHLAGLLHDIGKIVFEQYFHAQFEQAVGKSAAQNRPLYEVELELIGADHAEVGAWLANKWHITPQLAEVIRWHHSPQNASREHQDIATLCHIANFICNSRRIGESGDSKAPQYVPDVWERLGLNSDDVSAISQQVEDESARSEILLSLMQ